MIPSYFDFPLFRSYETFIDACFTHSSFITNIPDDFDKAILYVMH